MDLEDFDSLMRLAQRSVAANANSEAFTNLAIAQTYGDGLEAALTNAARAIELDPLGARAYTVRSHIYHGLGKRDLAARDRREWERLEKLHPPTSTKSSN